MHNRIEYLSSDQGGNMQSDFLTIKKQLQIFIRVLDNELLDHLPANSNTVLFAEAVEASDAETRKNERFTYMKEVVKWLKRVKKIAEESVKKATQSKPPTQNDEYNPLADEEALPASSVSPVVLSLPELSLASINPKIKVMKRLLDKMEEARQAERYLEVYEIRIHPHSGKVRIDTLNYHPERGAYELEDKQEFQPTFRIITGGRRLKDHDDVVTPFSQEEYFALQELGATARRETTLIAKLINEYGNYRRSVINSAIRFQIRTDTWIVKEQICRQAIERFRTLQDIESAYGAEAAEINTKIVSYQEKITDLIAIQEKSLETLNAILPGSEQQDYSEKEMQWLKDVLENHIKGLHGDLRRLQDLQKNPVDAVSEKSIAHWLQKQTEHIIENAKLNAELVDISGKKGISLGRFSSVTARAFELARTFQFPPHKRVYPAHQGIFDPEGRGNQLILSSIELASGERNIRDVLFAFSCVKAGLISSDQLDDVMEQSHAQEVTHRGYGRLSKLWNRGAKREAIDKALAESDTLNMIQTTWELYYALRDNVRSTSETYGHAAKKVFADMGRALKDSAEGAVEEITDVSAQFGRNIKRDFTYNHVVLPRQLNQDIQLLHYDSHAETRLQSASELIEEKIPAFQSWNPNTLYSVVDNFLEQFGGFFITRYEASPFIWTMATLLGALSGATAFAGPAVKAMLLKCGCPEGLANGFVNVSQAISTATSKSPVFQMVGTGSTVQQGLFVVLDTMATGADSFTAQAIAELKRNLPIAVCVIAGSTFGGWALGSFEFFHDEFGSMPLIAEFFTGLKFAGFGYEAVMHEPGEKSALANTVASGMNGAYNLVRATASLLQLIVVVPGGLMASRPDVVHTALANFLRPSLDLTDTSVRFLVSTLDVMLRCSATTSRGAKSVVKAALETPVNLLAKLARIVELEQLSKALVRGKSIAGTSFDDNFARPLHNITRTVRRGYATLMTQDDMYLGANPLRLSNSSHSFFQTIRKRNLANQQVDEPEMGLAPLPSPKK
jgi:hypothetical protein